MSEAVVRYRGGGTFDADGNPVAGVAPVTFSADAVGPGPASAVLDRGRNAVVGVYVLYFRRVVDIVDGDEVEVRGDRYRALVDPWKSPYSKLVGTAVTCTIGQG